MTEQWTDVHPLVLYCRECFVGWPLEQTECWQCGCPFAITRAEGVGLG